MDNDNKTRIVTHSSGFHTDDVFAVATLLLVVGEEKEVEIIRSREKEVHKTADYVVDTGNEYDPDRNRFDHHQEGGAGKRENGVPYASFGLVWKKFGQELTGSKKGLEMIDQMIVQPIDAGDNGLRFLQTTIPNLYPFDIGRLVFLFAPTWKEETSIDEVFIKLVSYAKVIISRLIVSVKDDIEAEKLVLDCYNTAPDKRLILLNERYPWEEVLSQFPLPLFVVYKNQQGQWSIKTIRDDMFSYEPRKKLPESWAGKRMEELEKVTGVKDAVFCHNARFMAVAKTKEAVLKLAEIALNS
ncbi:MAG TPA: MYG1 family protein [Candidatus Paceibacterota bacterium]